MIEFRRTTRQRQVILEELQKLTSHPTAAEVYEIVRKRLPKVSLGTVYRNLELLAQNRTIQKLDISSTEAEILGYRIEFVGTCPKCRGKH
jgi:Fur family ferric uptake transcriptional regulator